MDTKIKAAFRNLIEADRVVCDFEGENGEKYYHLYDSFFMEGSVTHKDGYQIPVVISIPREKMIEAYESRANAEFLKDIERTMEKHKIVHVTCVPDLPDYLKEKEPDDDIF